MIFNLHKQREAHEYLDHLLNEGATRIDKVKPRRSLNQNAYMHGVVFSIFAIEKGWTMPEAKQYFKDQFLSYEKDGQTFTKETSKLDTKEMEVFLENCRTHSLLQHECMIPLPNEVTVEMLELIDRFDKYLK